MEEKYKEYLFWCNASGDIWNSIYQPLSYEEWVEVGKPESIGEHNEYCKKYEKLSNNSK